MRHDPLIFFFSFGVFCLFLFLSRPSHLIQTNIPLRHTDLHYENKIKRCQTLKNYKTQQAIVALSPLHLSVSPGLMYEEEGALIELMICAIKQAAEVTPPVGRTQSKKVVSEIYAIILWIVYVFMLILQKKGLKLKSDCTTQSRNKFHILLSVSDAGRNC